MKPQKTTLKLYPETGGAFALFVSVFFWLVMGLHAAFAQRYKFQTERIGKDQQVYVYEGMKAEDGRVIIPAVYDYIWDFGIDTLTLARRQITEARPNRDAEYQYELITYNGYLYTEFPSHLIPSPPQDGIMRFYDMQKEAFGFMNTSGKEISKAKFSEARDFREGLAAVLDPFKGYWGYIDQNGKMVIRATFDEAYSFSEGKAVINENGKFYFCDRNAMLRPILGSYSRVFDLQDGVSVVMQDTLYGLIDSTGREIVKPRFQFLDNFENGISVFLENGNAGVLDKLGNVRIEARYNNVFRFDQNHYVVEQNGLRGLINLKGEMVIQPRYTEIGYFSEGLAPVLLGGKWGFVDSRGTEIIPCEYASVDRVFVNGVAEVSEKDNWLLVHKGDTLKLPEYDEILPYYGFAAAFRKGNYWGFLNEFGEESIEAQYEELIFSKGGLCFGLKTIGDTAAYALINSYGKEIVPAKYIDIVRFTEGRAAVKTSQGWGFIDENGTEIVRPQYDVVRNYASGRAAVQKNGQWAFLSLNGAEAIAMFSGYPDLSELENKPNNFSDSLLAIREVFPLYLVEVIGDFDGTYAAVEDLTTDNSSGNFLCLSKTGKLSDKTQCEITERYADSFEPAKEQNQSFRIIRIAGKSIKIDAEGKKLE
ncbi:MAG: WG repeat-containing protein [Bacteroidia bacterium]